MCVCWATVIRVSFAFFSTKYECEQEDREEWEKTMQYLLGLIYFLIATAAVFNLLLLWWIVLVAL